MSRLDSLNTQYRLLARAGHTDSNGKLKSEIIEVNGRWDELEKRTSAVNRRLRHILNVFDDFNATRKALAKWLHGIDQQITDVQPFTGENVQNKHDKIQVGEDNDLLNSFLLGQNKN